MKWFFVIGLVGLLGIVLTNIVVNDPQAIETNPFLIFGFFGLALFVIGMPAWLAVSILNMKPKQERMK